MQQVSFFLEKFKTLGADSVSVKEAFIKSAQKIFNIKIELSDIQIKNGTIYIKAHPALKSEIFLKREALLRELTDILGTMKVTALR